MSRFTMQEVPNAMSAEPDNKQPSRGNLSARIGTFLVLLGIFFFIIFIASDFAEQPDFDWLFMGLLFLVIGIILRQRAPAPAPSERFSGIKRLRESARKRGDEKQEKN
jgi:glycerol uptake facilitator-like aquaporin